MENKVQRILNVIQNLEKAGLKELGVGTKFALYLESTCNFTLKDDNFELLKALLKSEDLSKISIDDNWDIASESLKTAYVKIITAIKEDNNTEIENAVNENKELLLKENLLENLEDLEKLLRASRVEDSLFVYNVFVGKRLERLEKLEKLEKLESIEHINKSIKDLKDTLELYGSELIEKLGSPKKEEPEETESELVFDNTELTPVIHTIRINGKEYNDESAYDYMKKQLISKNGVGRAVMLAGVPGTGKTTLALEFVDRYNKEHGLGNNMKFISFSSKTDRGDFIIGTSLQGVQLGVFKELCDEALKHKDRMYFIVIDEITRGDAPLIISEALTGMDRRNTPISLGKYKEKLIVPNNICIIATSNTRDNSLLDLDVAIKDRFYMLNIEPIWQNSDCLDVLADELRVRVDSDEYKVLKELCIQFRAIDEMLESGDNNLDRVGTRAIQKCADFSEVGDAIKNRMLPRLEGVGVKRYVEYILNIVENTWR